MVKNISGQYCYFDSIDNVKYQYNQNGKVELFYRTIWWYPPYNTATSYSKLYYNSDNLLALVERYAIAFNGDTVANPFVEKTYEYEDGLLSKITWYDDCYFDDFIWDDNKLLEYKYYYFWGDTIIDSSQTRLLQFTYFNNNIYHFFYYELATGTVFADQYYYYDNKINPYYESEVSLVTGNLLDYMMMNNWNSNSSGDTRTITYNAQNYPVYIITNASNGNIHYETIVYDCTNTTPELSNENNPKLELIPNPANDFFEIKNDNNQEVKEVKLYNLNGIELFHAYNTNKVCVRGMLPGIFIVECVFEGSIIRKKIIVNTN